MGIFCGLNRLRPIIAIAGILTAWTLCSGATPNPRANPNLGQNVDLLRIVVLDVSGSMSTQDTGTLSRLDTARRELLDSLKMLPASDKTPVVLIPFCDDVLSAPIRTYTDNAQLEQALSQLAADGSTNIAAGLREAIRQAQQHNAAKNLLLYLYSDGENTCGPVSLVYEQERNLDTLFGQRATRGLSQTVVVKRWGGVIGDMVARLQKNPNVQVVDAGQLELRTVTLIPAASVQDITWRDPTAGLALIQVQAMVNNTGGTGAAFPPTAAVEMSCPLVGSQWLNEPRLALSGPAQPRVFQLLVKLDPEQLNPTQSYSLPLRFQGPSLLKTDRGLAVVITNPSQILCPLPTNRLCPKVTVQAALSAREKPRWQDLPNRVAFWPMRLRLEPQTTPPLAWREQVLWEVRALDGIKVTPVRVTMSHGPAQDLNVDLIKNLSLDEVAQGRPVKVRLEMTPVAKPRTLNLSSDRLLVTAEVDLPPLGTTKIHQQVSSVGEPEWSDLVAGLVTVPVKLIVTIDGLLSPGAVLGLAPCADVVKVDGVPVAVRSGSQTVEIRLTGKAISAGRRLTWPLNLLPPPPAYGIRYETPATVSVTFTTPQAVQIVLGDEKGILLTRVYQGRNPSESVSGGAVLQLVGGRMAPSAAANLHVRGLLENPLDGTGFSAASPSQSVGWSVRPLDPATSVRWWRDVEVKGALVLLPENAAPGIVQGSMIPITLTFEALYKKVVFALAVGLGLVLIGAVLFWLTRACLGGSVQHTRAPEPACGA
ncbi:MAG: vWA domain-containing protein [Phycisphaerae bacterium]